jgi:hypothetical protein
VPSLRERSHGQGLADDRRRAQIPYNGSAPAITDLVGGQIQVLFDPFSTLYPQVAAGKVGARWP